MTKFPLLLGLAITALPGLAGAHGIYMAQRAGDTAIVYGHGASDEAYKAEKVKSIAAFAEDGKKLEVKREMSGKYLVVSASAPVAAYASVYDNGYWSEGADGKWKNLPKKEVPGAKSAGHYIKYNTHIAAKLSGALKPTGATLEIVPLEDPVAVKAGGELAVQVLFKGKPYAGVQIVPDYVNQAHDKTSAKTDAEGKIKVAVPNDGLNVMAVSVSEETPNDANADKIGHFATLSFALPHEED